MKQKVMALQSHSDICLQNCSTARSDRTSEACSMGINILVELWDKTHHHLHHNETSASHGGQTRWQKKECLFRFHSKRM